MIEIETYSSCTGGQRFISDAQGLRWSTHYSEEGSGYGYLQFSLPRKGGQDYSDIGFGYRIIVRKYVDTILFDGNIRQIEDSSGPNGDSINVTAMGAIIEAGDDELLRAFCDSRLTRWERPGENPNMVYRPDLFAMGSNELGLFIHPNSGAEIARADYTMLDYDFYPEETAKRIKFDFTAILGAGVIFEADVDRVDVDNGRIYYKNDSGESWVVADMVLNNLTQGKETLVSSIDTGSNYIAVESATAIGGWEEDDEIIVIGPIFRAAIDDITGAVITYVDDIGEDNILNDWHIANITKKSVATVSAHDDGANTITVTDSDHLLGWEETDVIMQCAQLFYAQMDGAPAANTITYKNALGERLVKSDVRWTLYNETQDDFARVASWNTASSQLNVVAAVDIAGWVNDDVLRIYAPLRIRIYDSDYTMVWPTPDERIVGKLHNRTPVDATVAGSKTGFHFYIWSNVAGTYSETVFFQFSNLRVYSTEDAVTAEMLAKVVVGLLSGAGHSWDSSEDEIEAITKVLEPMVFEFTSPREAMKWACSIGDSSGDAVAWGIRLDDRRRFFLEVQDRSTIGYVVRRTAPVEMSVAGDLDESWQYIRGVYTDILGEQQFTDWQYDEDAYFGDDYFRRKSVLLDNINNEADAEDAIAKYLVDNKLPRRESRYTAYDGSVFTRHGTAIPIDEMQATGKLIRVEDWRSVEGGLSSTDLRDSWTTEQIVGVEIDYDGGSATLIPASAKKTFEMHMAEISRLAAG